MPNGETRTVLPEEKSTPEINLAETAQLPEFQEEKIEQTIREYLLKTETAVGLSEEQFNNLFTEKQIQGVRQLLTDYFLKADSDNRPWSEVVVKKNNFLEQSGLMSKIDNDAEQIYTNFAVRKLLAKEGIIMSDKILSINTNNFRLSLVDKFESVIRELGHDGQDLLEIENKLYRQLLGKEGALADMGISWGECKKEKIKILIEIAKLEGPIIEKVLEKGHSWKEIWS